jgi:putative FmdB family regulatory protein
MPVYEYECSACGGRFELMQKFSDPAPTVCQLCKAEGVRKVLSATSFVLKGSGWYATDYPSADRKKAGSSESQAGPSESKTEPKPATPCGAACPAGGCPSKS